MTITQDAFKDLFPEKEVDQYQLSITYSDHFKPYNANVKKRGKDIHFHLSKKWRTVSREIQIGLLQELLLKLFKKKMQTTNMDLYSHFMKSIHIAAPQEHDDPLLRESHRRVNDYFFGGLLDITNLKWGTHSTTKLGCYEYGSDTITMSTIFKEAKPELLDYVMYHEMLHKKVKFTSKNGRSRYHSKQFRDLEAQYPDQERIEHEIGQLASKHKVRKSFWSLR